MRRKHIALSKSVTNTMLGSFLGSHLPWKHFTFYMLHLLEKGLLILTYFKEVAYKFAETWRFM